MQLGMIGLGRMGGNMVRRLLRAKHQCVVFDHAPEQVRRLANEGAVGAASLDEFVRTLTKPRAAWVMVPAGDATEQTVTALAERMESGDTIIDGGNSFFKEDIARAESLAAHKLRYLDIGTSGGVWGLQVGYCMMIGGERSAFEHIEPILKTLAPEGTGYGYMGSAGAGHFVKMVHNGIEYGMMQAYGEGFELLQASRWDLDLGAIADLWGKGSVVRSWLLELAADAFRKDPGLEQIAGYVDDTGEGRWTVEQAIELGVPMPIIANSLFMRFRSRQPDSFSAKVLAALRNEFGGHAVKEKE